MTEYVSHNVWNNYAKQIERENMKQSGGSLTYTAIARRASGFIVEVRDDGMLVKPGWREAMCHPAP